jgi:hypothetical protein
LSLGWLTQSLRGRKEVHHGQEVTNVAAALRINSAREFGAIQATLRVHVNNFYEFFVVTEAIEGIEFINIEARSSM